MNREEFNKALNTLVWCAASNESATKQKLLAEFDRLTQRVAELAGKLWDAQDEPQQPDKSLEQKIQRIFDDNARDADCHEACIPREYYGEVILEILALLQPQQPVEGELVVNPYTCFCHQNREISHGEEDEDIAHHEFESGSQAQLAHDKQRMVSIDWLDQSCPHSEPLALVTRRECDECMEELSSQGQREEVKP